MSVQRGEVIINGEDVLDIINQRNNFLAVLEGAEYRNLDNIGNGDIKTARKLGELTAAMTKAALAHCGEDGKEAIEKVQIDFFSSAIIEAMNE